MDKLFDWIQKQPAFVKIGLVIAIFCFVGYFLFVSVMGGGKKKEPEKTIEQIVFQSGEAVVDTSVSSKSSIYESTRFSVSNEDDYWNSLSPDGSDKGMTVSDNNVSSQSVDPSTLDRSEYSELEIYLITNGAKTKEEIDREHLQEKAEKEREKNSEPKELTSEQEDSIFMARMDKAYQMAMKYTQPQVEPQKKEEEPKEPEPRRLKFDGSNAQQLSDEMFQSDGICSSLDGSFDSSLTYDSGKITVHPVKATFIRSEKIIAGQRVTMRLLQDLVLSNGKTVPANTHIQGICSIGKRLEIKITTLQYGGRMYRSDLSVYDNDGTEGIYCPVIEKSKGASSAATIGSRVASDIAQDATALFSGSRILSDIAGSGVRELSRFTLSDGSVAINVLAGYEFYIFENIEKLEREK